MFSYHDNGRLQAVQCEPGQLGDSRRGSRWMQTLRKLPIISPVTPTVMPTSRLTAGCPPAAATSANHRRR
jgi:hypothetical protein